MIARLMPDRTAESALRALDEIDSLLDKQLGAMKFKSLFPLILTDNGSELCKTLAIETNMHGEKRTKVFYCDPYASFQKRMLKKITNTLDKFYLRELLLATYHKMILIL
jgi:IS30 family transposase